MIKLTVKKGGGNSSFINNRLFSLIIGFLKPILCRLFCQTQGQSPTTHSIRDWFKKRTPKNNCRKNVRLFNMQFVMWLHKCHDFLGTKMLSVFYFYLEVRKSAKLLWHFRLQSNYFWFVFIILCKTLKLQKNRLNQCNGVNDKNFCLSVARIGLVKIIYKWTIFTNVEF